MTESGRHRPGEARWWRGPILRRSLVGVAIGAGLLVVLAVPPALGARRELTTARSAMVAGKAAFLAGEPKQAGTSFATAEAAFREARDRASNPALRVLGFLPVIGRSPDVVASMAEAGTRVAAAGRILVEAVEDLPGGAAALAPRGGRIPVRPLRRLAGPLGRARALMDGAGAIMARAPDSWLLAPLVDPRAEFARELADVRGTVTAADDLVQALPAFLGDDGARTYLVGAQNPAELRGTGGFLGAYAVLTAREGRLHLGSFRDIGSLRNLPPSRVEPPNPDYGDRFRRFGGAGFWPNINMTGDFPSAATAIERLYRATTGRRVDGVVVADPQALAALLQVTGPEAVPGLGVRVDADSVVSFVSNRAYALIPDSAARKRLLGEVAGRVLGRFLEGPGGSDPAAAGRTLIGAAADGHLLLHAADPRVQRAFGSAHVTGALVDPPGDALAFVVNNAGGNKVDFYARRSLRYVATVQPDGVVAGSATVAFRNEAPRHGPPTYVIGPYPGVSQAGENIMIASAYCAPGCRPAGFRRDGRDEPVDVETELGHPVLTANAAIPAGASERFEYRWLLPGGWDGDDRGGTYRLTVQGQTTIRPTRLRVEVRIPEGMEVVRTSPDMEVVGNRAIWVGTARDRTDFEVEFTRPFLGRLWRAVWIFLNRPLTGSAPPA